MYKKLDQRGFHHVLMIALIVVVVAAVGFTGWYVWDKNKTDDSANTTNPTPTPSVTVTPTEAPTPTSAPDPTADWKTGTGNYYGNDYGFTYKIPSDWPVNNSFPVQKSLLALTTFLTGYSLEVYSNTPDSTGLDFISSYFNDIEVGPSDISTVQINGETAYKFFMAKAATTGGGTGYILFYNPGTQHTAGVVVAFEKTESGKTASDILSDATLNLIASTFSFN